MLFEEHFTKLADEQFLTALAWVSLPYKTRTTPGRVLKSRAVHQGQPRIHVPFASLWSALLSCNQLLIGMA